MKITKLQIQKSIAEVTGINLDQVKLWTYDSERETYYDRFSGSSWEVNITVTTPTSFEFHFEYASGETYEYKDLLDNMKSEIERVTLQIEQDKELIKKANLSIKNGETLISEFKELDNENK